MSEPENFLSRWSRRKREAETAPEAEAQAQPAPAAAPEDVAKAPAAEEPDFDLSSLPSLDQIAADTDVSVFMKTGVPSALRHAALRRAWASDPAIRDFRGLQENDWDFNAPDGVPGFGSFKSDEEVKALAQRLFGADRPEDPPVSQSAPDDSGAAPPAEAQVRHDGTRDADRDTTALADDRAPQSNDATAVQHESNAAMQRTTVRRHGGALPQ